MNTMVVSKDKKVYAKGFQFYTVGCNPPVHMINYVSRPPDTIENILASGYDKVVVYPGFGIKPGIYTK